MLGRIDVRQADLRRGLLEGSEQYTDSYFARRRTDGSSRVSCPDQECALACCLTKGTVQGLITESRWHLDFATELVAVDPLLGLLECCGVCILPGEAFFLRAKKIYDQPAGRFPSYCSHWDETLAVGSKTDFTGDRVFFVVYSRGLVLE